MYQSFQCSSITKFVHPCNLLQVGFKATPAHNRCPQFLHVGSVVVCVVLGTVVMVIMFVTPSTVGRVVISKRKCLVKAIIILETEQLSGDLPNRSGLTQSLLLKESSVAHF